jgi:hypothetical protein
LAGVVEVRGDVEGGITAFCCLEVGFSGAVVVCGGGG